MHTGTHTVLTADLSPQTVSLLGVFKECEERWDDTLKPLHMQQLLSHKWAHCGVWEPGRWPGLWCLFITIVTHNSVIFYTTPHGQKYIDTWTDCLIQKLWTSVCCFFFGSKDLLSFGHLSIAEVQQWCWLIKPGSQSVFLFKGVWWCWGRALCRRSSSGASSSAPN